MKKAIVIVGIVAVAALVVVLFLPMLIQNNASSMDITFYDKDGNVLGKANSAGVLGLGIHGEGIEGEIYSLKVVVYFRVTTDIDYSNVNTYCWLEVVTTLDTITGGHVHTVPKHSLGVVNTDLEGSFYRTTEAGHYYMAELLPDSAIEDTGKANGWNMKFSAWVETTVRRSDGTYREIADTCGITLKLTWVENLELESWVGFS